MRSDTEAMLGTVSNTFELIDHAEMGRIIEALCGETNVKFETAGSCKGGAQVWALVYLDEPYTVAGDDSQHLPFLAVLNSHDGTGACKATMCQTRVVCWNTVQAADATLLSVQPVIKWNGAQRTESASANFAGQSRLPGVAINYVLKSAATGDVKVLIYDGSRQIMSIDGTKNAGINSVRWNLNGQREAGAADAAGGRGGRGRGGAGGAAGGNVTYSVDPGEYRVVLSVGGREFAQNALVLPDPSK